MLGRCCRGVSDKEVSDSEVIGKVRQRRAASGPARSGDDVNTMELPNQATLNVAKVHLGPQAACSATICQYSKHPMSEL